MMYLWASIWSSVHNLRGSVQRTAAKCLKKLVFMVEVGQTKICNLGDKINSVIIVSKKGNTLKFTFVNIIIIIYRIMSYN